MVLKIISWTLMFSCCFLISITFSARITSKSISQFKILGLELLSNYFLEKNGLMHLVFSLSWTCFLFEFFLLFTLLSIIYFFQNVTNFIQLVSPQLVDQFLQIKLYQKALNEGYLHIYGMYKSNNRLLRYKTISDYRFYQLLFQE